jgi:hypothetical protein
LKICHYFFIVTIISNPNSYPNSNPNPNPNPNPGIETAEDQVNRLNALKPKASPGFFDTYLFGPSKEQKKAEKEFKAWQKKFEVYYLSLVLSLLALT